MTVLKYDLQADTLTFSCKKCSTEDSTAVREIPLSTMAIFATENAAVQIKIPPCPECGMCAAVLPPNLIKGEASLIRAVLFKRLQDAGSIAPGSDQGKLSAFREALDSAASECGNVEWIAQYAGTGELSEITKMNPSQSVIISG